MRIFPFQSYDGAGIGVTHAGTICRTLENVWCHLKKCVVLRRENVCPPLFSLQPIRANNPTVAAALEDPDRGRQCRGSQDDPNHRAAVGN